MTPGAWSASHSEKPFSLVILPRAFRHCWDYREAILPSVGENDMIPITLEAQQQAFGGGYV
jgi:hypothetical protein